VFDQYKLVMFDCDGTLIDSEYLYNRVLSKLLIKDGYSEYSVDRCCELFAGTSYDYVKNYMIANMPDINQVKFQARFEKKAIDEAIAHLKSIDGVEEVLTALSAKKKCIVTNGEKNVIDFTLKVTKLDRFFEKDQLFSYEMAERSKPYPDLYQLAARQNGVLESECITIEDTVIGAKASISAGIKTIGFIKSHRLDKHYASKLKQDMQAAGVYAVIEDMRDYLKFL